MVNSKNPYFTDSAIREKSVYKSPNITYLERVTSIQVYANVNLCHILLKIYHPLQLMYFHRDHRL